MNNLKKFATEAEYTAAIGSLSYPNVSWVESGDTLHYNLELPQTKLLEKRGDTVVRQYYCDGNPITTGETIPRSDTSAEVTDIIVGDCVEIGYQYNGYLFADYYSLSSITIPSTALEIPAGFVAGCGSLKSFDIPNSVTRIAWQAFWLSGIEELTIPSGVTEIEAPALDMPSATSITCLATVPPTLTYVAMTQYLTGITIYVPSASVSAYEAASGWSDLNIQAIPEAPKVVATYNATRTSKPTEITNYQTLSGISKMYVDGVELPNVVADYTFSTTGTHTVEFELADSTKIPYYMFRSSGFWPLTVIVPSSVTSFEDYAFYQGPTNTLTIEATVPPTLLGSNSLVYSKTAPTIYVPSASVSAYQSASGWSTYAAYIQAIP